ncbi:tumor necrosis factor receptor superfamily member 16-like [Brienomyrus brachyistius]|uniref:tumor necrosis factor receptor superfamily member 16-like n=1 Tax=Brienomyrus brachyistius TaxID=42636 RepID=UPI0020B3D14C|nr:tumor necrosis factor receptor superfamily member 16-like [Brienomyrus brachyistius]
MGSSILMLLLLAAATIEPNAHAQSCHSGQFTSTGECCRQCQPGEGMVKQCGRQQTVCSQCLDSETFSENYSHTEVCQPCTKCTGLMRMLTPCTDSNDAICVCDYGYFMSEMTGKCEPCTLCPVGIGVLLRCEYDRDTICEECIDETYSDQESSLDPCLPCSICDSTLDVELQPCSKVKDTMCQAINPTYPSASPEPSMFPFFSENPMSVPPPDGATTAMPSSPKPFGQGLNKKLIPIYCSILAAVVVGLVAFIVFKKWNSCKQNKQGSNNCAVSQTPSPEGEKLHSDSGISVDSQSLQEQQQQQQVQAHTVVKIDGESNLTIPPHKCEEVEKLLNQGCGGEGTGAEDDTDWCNLAGLLGYEDKHINSFRQEEHPVRALLSDWASKDCASLDALCSALRKINRDDVAQSLITATSAV